MLQKFLFVGVGGSGGVTLRALRALLVDYLAEHGYEGDIPAAWQFVHIDVPLEQDRRPERIPLLPRNNYVGLAVEGLYYRNVDAMMCGQSESVVRHTAGWRPDPVQVNVAPESGGGRFRAVGRVVLGARMAAAHERLSRAVQALSGEAANEEFGRVCLELTGQGEPSELPPQVLVIGSLAGGSGSALLGDTCDMLRQLEPSVEDRMVSILYSPQVFDELAPADRSGVNPNALAALSELLNGRWNRDPVALDEFAFIQAAGAAAVTDVQRRGPRVPYMIGKSNGKVTFDNQGDVYEAVARGLAVWATSGEIQSSFSTHEIGNWSERSSNKPDTTGLIGTNNELPLSSFGCASVGIGLDRFARYTVDRLTREAAEHLLSGHWRHGDEKKINEEEARRIRVDIQTPAFLADCKLDEKGAHRNDIIDAIRGDMSDAAAREAMGGQLRQQLLSQVTERWPHQARADVVGRIVIERMDNRWSEDFANYQRQYTDNAIRWAGRLQGVIERHTAELVAKEGARVAVDVLAKVMTELKETVDADLEPLLRSHERLTGDMRNRVRAALAGTSTSLPANHPRVEQAVDAALDSFHSRTEELVYDLAIALIADVCENLLSPLRQALQTGMEELEIDRTGTAVQPSPVPGWPTNSTTVPTAYYPARNELVLEKVTDYPRVFTEQICAQSNDPLPGNAVMKARHEIITGIREDGTETQRVIETIGSWVPRDVRMRQDQRDCAASFTVHIGVSSLRDRARRWIRRPNTPLARHLEQKLGDYLDERGGGGQAHQAKLESFRNLFAAAVAISKPLIDIDPRTLSKVHGGREIGFREVMTPLPFPEGHPGREVAAKVFAKKTKPDFESLFGPQDTQRIDIFTFLDLPVQPVVMASLVNPIRRQWEQDRTKPAMAGFWTWRRARQLPWFVPCTPEIRKAMVCGWFVARFLNQIRCHNNDPRAQRTEIWIPDSGFQPFPFPLLGKQIAKLDEWMPAVLESLALTIVGESFTPYARLVHLGKSVATQDAFTEPGALVRWISTGVPEPGAPTPAGNPDGRLDIVTETLDKFERHYDKYRSLRITAAEGLTVSRAWELRDDVMEALGVIRHAVENATTVPDEEEVG